MISTKPASGTRDFLGTDVVQRHYVIDVIKNIYESYGFEPLETPTYERLSTLLGKYGEEGNQLIFRILQRGKKLQTILSQEVISEADLGDLGLRYDLTVPLARVVAEYKNQLPRFYKRYQMQPVWRADRPGRGRFREFWQCDVDIVGSKSAIVEAEVISAVTDVLIKLGFDKFQVRLNHRQILRGLLEVSGIPMELENTALIAIDKIDKIGEQGVRVELLTRNVPQKSVDKLMPLLAQDTQQNDSLLQWLGTVLEDSVRGLEGVHNLNRIMELLKNTSAKDYVQIDPYLARGLSYYTGAIFEIAESGLPGSLGGGGRYDDLIGMFSKQSLPACGFAIGLERIVVLMQEREMFPEYISKPYLLLTSSNEKLVPKTIALATELRKDGLSIDIYPNAKDSYGKQFRYAEERGIQFVILYGEQEINEDKIAIKDLQTGKQITIKHERVIDTLKSLFDT